MKRLAIISVVLACGLLPLGPVATYVATVAEAQQVSCPVHGDSGAYFTGKTQTMDGVLLYEYRCPRGHTFWVRAN